MCKKTQSNRETEINSHGEIQTQRDRERHRQRDRGKGRSREGQKSKNNKNFKKKMEKIIQNLQCLTFVDIINSEYVLCN